MAIVRKYQSVVSKVDQPLPNIFVVTFRALEKVYKFKPGQFLHLALDPFDPTKPWPESRCFSMQTPPGEDFLRITYSVVGYYTSRMSKELTEGKEVCLKLAYGDLFQKVPSKENCVFVAGGTGITPYLSLFTSPEFSEYSNPVLYLGVKNQAYNIYQADLNKAVELNGTLKTKIIDQEREGMLDIKTIFKENGHNVCYFISGPPAMISSFSDELLKRNVRQEFVRTDRWQ